MNPAENRLASALEKRRSENALRTLIPADPSFVDFCSNDYLGLARSERFMLAVEKEWETLRASKTGQLVGSGGSRLLAGDSEYAHALEKELAEFYKAEAGLLFNSGYLANIALFSCLPKKGDTIIYDELIHASVRDGMRLSQAKAWGFRHNDVAHLEELLAKAEGTVYIAAEAIYSMDGDACPLEEIVALCEKYKAALILDEAHSNGLYGENGEGLAVALRLEQKVFARLLTFGKAPGCHGALVAGSALLREYLVNFARPFIYTTALPVHDLAVIRASVRYFSNRHELRAKLAELVDHFHKTLPGALSRPFSAIQTVLIPGNAQVKAVAAACREKRLDVRAILSPTVPEGQERLRVILHAFNTKAEIDQLAGVIGGAAAC